MPGLTPFVGRRRELSALLEYLDRAGQGHGHLVLVAGEPGVGKTRLARELAERAGAEGWHATLGRAYDSEGMPPYLPLVEALRTYSRDCPIEQLRIQLGEGAADVAIIVRELRARLPELSTGPPLTSEHERYRFFESVSDFLLNIARSTATGRGLLLVLDDLHWADKPTLLLLQHLARKLSAAPLLVVGTYRPLGLDPASLLSDVLAELSREQLAERLTLPALSPEEAAVLIERLTGATAQPTIMQAIYRQTEGNPFFLEELLRHLQAEGHDLADARIAVAPREVPEGVRQVIDRRLARLSASANRMLQVSAVLGDTFAHAVLLAASGMELDLLLDALDEALAAGVLRQEDQHCHFTHTLIRQTIYSRLNPLRRMHLHHQVAEALERVYAANPERHLAQLAHHFCSAVPSTGAEKAVEYASRAGDRALSLLAYEEGARLYELALRSLDLAEHPDEVRRCRLLLAQGEAQRKAGDLHQAIASFQQAAEIARTLFTAPKHAEAASLLAAAALGFEDILLLAELPRTGPDDPSILLQREALDALEDTSGPIRVRLLAGLARALHFAGSHQQGAALSEQAVETARRVGDSPALAYALNARRMILWGPDNLEERLSVATELRELAERVGDRELVLEGCRWRLIALLELGDIHAADVEIEAYGRLAEELREAHYLSFVATWRAMRALLDGRFADAEQLAHQAREIGSRAQRGDAVATSTTQMISACRALGKLAELGPLETTARRLLQKDPPGMRAELALTLLEMGRVDEARKAFDQAAAADFGDIPRDWLWLHIVVVLSEVCALLGDTRRASTLYGLLRPYAARYSVEPSNIGFVAYYLGLLATTLGRWDEAQAHFGAALGAYARIGAVPGLARTAQDYAALLLARRGRDDLVRARELLGMALATYAELGMPRDEARVRALLAESGPEPAPPPARTYPAGLTGREVEVLRLIAEGKTNREIAEELVLSIRTVERHISNLYGKIDARGKADATAFALRHGLT